ncbi:hypothetical protein [Burkholderia multivorans]|uniref:hypothetical protein n=1 Tax=Burkholderia multivorans TaxID=87883 RepID=UPI0021C10003|nr:hypothetical protein [Burkholderia multivorans]
MDDIKKFDLLGLRITAARQGDAEAAQKLIAEFCATVRQNRERVRDENGHFTGPGQLGAKPLVRIIGDTPYSHTSFDERLLDYLAECFEKVLSGKDQDGKRVSADKALNLTSNQRGRKTSKSTRPRTLGRGQEVYEAYQAKTNSSKPPKLNKRSQTGPLWDAIREVAEIRRISADTAARDYEEWLKLLDSFPDSGNTNLTQPDSQG